MALHAFRMRGGEDDAAITRALRSRWPAEERLRAAFAHHAARGREGDRSELRERFAAVIRRGCRFYSDEWMTAWQLQNNPHLAAPTREVIEKIMQADPRAFLVLPNDSRVAHFRRAQWGFPVPRDVERMLGPQGISFHDAAVRQIVNMARERYGSDVKIEEAPLSRYIGQKSVAVIPDVAVYGTTDGDVCYEVQASYENGPSFEERDATRLEKFDVVSWVFLESALRANAAGRRKLAKAGREFWHGIPVPEKDDARLSERKYDVMRIFIMFNVLVPGQLALTEGFGPDEPLERPIKLQRTKAIDDFQNGIGERPGEEESHPAPELLDSRLAAFDVPDAVRRWNVLQWQGKNWAEWGWSPPAWVVDSLRP